MKKNKKAIKKAAQKLYDVGEYFECFEFLYKKTFSAKLLLWLLILFSYILSGISIIITINFEGNSAVAVVAAAVAGAAAVAAGAGAAVVAVAVAVAVVAAAVGVCKVFCWLLIKI